MGSKLFDDYLHEIEQNLATGQATEPSHYPALQKLIEGLGPGVRAIVNPKQIECGAPDISVMKDGLVIGYVEAKDVAEDLDKVEKSEQLERYTEALPNFVLTNFIEFRWFIKGVRRGQAQLATLEKGPKIKPGKAGQAAVAQLLEDFLKHECQGIGTPKELAQNMARLAHRIREGIVEALEKKAASQTLQDLHRAFADTLIPDLPAAQFADMYAQTLAYGLFAARCEAAQGLGYSRQNAATLIPKTNPFLKELFYQIAGPSLDGEPYCWAVDELVQVLRLADMSEVVKGFGKSTVEKDPVVYFYEDFLKEYDPATREIRGVYYTPLPVVSYIVRSIDYLLKNSFGVPQGLADKDVYILDPAVGTATFPYTIVNEIHDTIIKQGQQGTWNEYVAERLLPRLFGFELLMAPYAIAHLKLGLQLKEKGYQFGPDQRLGVYLTNTLEEAIKKAEMLLAGYIVKEANAAVEIKRDKPIMVVLGNPPYSGISANASVRREDFKALTNDKKRIGGKWVEVLAKRDLTAIVPNFIGELLDDYYHVDGQPLGEKNPKWLQDDYVKFIRFGQWRIERTGQGILGFITNHSYLDNPTFRGMRQSLMNSFTDIYIIDLHGNSKKRETAPDGSKDENVFDIQQGVAIGLFVKEAGKTGPAKVHHADLWGMRQGKYEYLAGNAVDSTAWQDLKPHSPFYMFVPRQEDLNSEYEKGWKVTDIFPVNSVGIVTARDELTIHYSRKDVWDTIQDFSSLPPEDARQKYNLGKDARDWKVTLAQEDIKKSGPSQAKVVRILYRPFDVRYTYYTGHSRGFICMPRPEVMRHMLAGGNLALMTTRQTRDPFAVLAVERIAAHKSVARYDINFVFPLYLYPQAEAPEGQAHQETVRRPNLNPAFVTEVEKRLGVRVVASPPGSETSPPAPSPLTERGLEGEVTSLSPSPSTERGLGSEVSVPRWKTDPALWGKLKPIARQMRREPTEAEDALWKHLRDRQLLRFKFRRQHSIERFIVDFYCAAAGLVVEVDGPVHQYQPEEDEIRQAFLESQGLRVLRFSNDHVLGDVKAVLQRIGEVLTSPPTPSPLAERG